MFEERIAQLNGTVKEKCTYTVSEICEILDVGKVSVYNLIRDGAFEAVLAENKYRIIKSSFDKWLDSDRDKEV